MNNKEKHMKTFSLIAALFLSLSVAAPAQAYDADTCSYHLRRAATFMKAGKMSDARLEIRKAEAARCPANVRFY